jgi:hypothetical protein
LQRRTKRQIRRRRPRYTKLTPLVHHSKRLGLRDPLACIRTASLRTGVSVSGKPNFLRRDKGDETSPGSSQRPWQRRSSRHNSANCALVTGQLGNLFESRNAWWSRQSLSNQSRRKIPAEFNTNGNLRVFQPFTGNTPAPSSANPNALCEIAPSHRIGKNNCSLGNFGMRTRI